MTNIIGIFRGTVNLLQVYHMEMKRIIIFKKIKNYFNRINIQL